MEISKQIEQIYEQLITDGIRLSTLLPQLYPIAIACKDYEGFCILFFWGKTINTSSGTNAPQIDELREILRTAGLKAEDITNIERLSFETYLSMRYVEKDKVCAFSAKEMEDYFARTDNIIAATDVPRELHPVDLYFRSQEAANTKLKILADRQPIEKQYAILQGYITSKLTYYQAVILQEERQKIMEKSIFNSKKVFIIHGHNEAKRRELESLLKDKFGLEPVVLSNQPNQGMTIIEKFEKYASQCSYAFALFTPDDIVQIPSGETYFQARPNVIFELGWFYSRLGRSRVCILDQESEKSNIFSDLQGVMRIQFSQNIQERYCEIREELESVKIL